MIVEEPGNKKITHLGDVKNGDIVVMDGVYWLVGSVLSKDMSRRRVTSCEHGAQVDAPCANAVRVVPGKFVVQD